MTMAELHQAGGVPPGWKMSAGQGDPAAGLRAFVDLGCRICHVVGGVELPEASMNASAPGPDLSGMGAHHPAAYFAESILDPSAVLVDGPGYIGPDGLSTMPTYPHMTVAQLSDIVAFLASLTEEKPHESLPAAPRVATSTAEVPPAPPGAASAFLVQSYDVRPGKLAELESWFAAEGAERLLSHGGPVAMETFVDRMSAGPSMTTVFAFDSPADLARFSTNGALREAKLTFDEFVGFHVHTAYDAPPIYRAPSLSAFAPGADFTCQTLCQGCHLQSFCDCRSAYHRLVAPSVEP
jgi:Cytochrome c